MQIDTSIGNSTREPLEAALLEESFPALDVPPTEALDVVVPLVLALMNSSYALLTILSYRANSCKV